MTETPVAGTEAGGGSRWRADSKPRLATKVRLQWNAARSQALLLYPEGALVLNPTARAVLELCDGKRTLHEIVTELAARFDASAQTASAQTATEGRPMQLSTDPGTDSVPDGAPDTGSKPDDTARTAAEPAPSSGEERERMIERDVKAFLSRLDQRGWLVDEAR